MKRLGMYFACLFSCTAGWAEDAAKLARALQLEFSNLEPQTNLFYDVHSMALNELTNLEQLEASSGKLEMAVAQMTEILSVISTGRWDGASSPYFLTPAFWGVEGNQIGAFDELRGGNAIGIREIFMDEESGGPWVRLNGLRVMAQAAKNMDWVLYNPLTLSGAISLEAAREEMWEKYRGVTKSRLFWEVPINDCLYRHQLKKDGQETTPASSPPRRQISLLHPYPGYSFGGGDGLEGRLIVDVLGIQLIPQKEGVPGDWPYGASLVLAHPLSDDLDDLEVGAMVNLRGFSIGAQYSLGDEKVRGLVGVDVGEGLIKGMKLIGIR